MKLIQINENTIVNLNDLTSAERNRHGVVRLYLGNISYTLKEGEGANEVWQLISDSSMTAKQASPLDLLR
jgi:hypothetical protein